MSNRRASIGGRTPLLFWPLAAIGLAFFALPFFGMFWRTPWSRVVDILTTRDLAEPLRLSLVTSVIAAALAAVFGIPLAWILARTRFVGRSLVRALCTLSMVLPPVVGGVALFFALGRRGVVGQYLLRWFDLTIPYSTTATVIAQTFVSMPFLVITVESAFRQLDPRFEAAARTLGANGWYVFRRVTLPTVRPALIAGVVLAWARALGEFGATITFAGNTPGRTQTMPLAIYLARESDQEAAVVLSLVLVAVSFAVLVALRDRWLGDASGGGGAVAAA